MPDWELIAVDDGSTDDTPRILGDWERRDRRIRVIRQDALGLVAALNRGLADARAPLLARLDADDRARPQRLERQLRHLDAHPGIGLLGSWAQKIDEHGTQRGQIKPATEPEQLSRALMQGNPFVHSSVMIPHRNGAPPERIPAGVPRGGGLRPVAAHRGNGQARQPSGSAYRLSLAQRATSPTATRSARLSPSGWRNARRKRGDGPATILPMA